MVILNGGIVGWSSQKQRCVSLSSMEAEYVALSACCRAVVRTQRILEELDAKISVAKIFEDNQSCVAWALNGGKRTKHIEVQYHYSRAVVARGEVVLE